MVGNIRKIRTTQGDDYTNDCLVDYLYFKDHYKLIAIDISKGTVIVLWMCSSILFCFNIISI